MFYGFIRTPVLGLAAVLAGAVVTNADATPIKSTFDASTEGWLGTVGATSVAHAATGGNPGGFLRVTDIGPNPAIVLAGPVFLTDLTAYDGGTMSFDAVAVTITGATLPNFGTITILGGGDSATLDFTTTSPPLNSWQNYSAPLSAATWGKTQGEWSSILTDVTRIEVDLDAYRGPEVIGVDNFEVAVPLPATAWLMAAGIGGLAWMRRRQRGWN